MAIPGGNPAKAGENALCGEAEFCGWKRYSLSLWEREALGSGQRPRQLKAPGEGHKIRIDLIPSPGPSGHPLPLGEGINSRSD